MSLIPEGSNLFVIDIEYIVPLEQVEPHIAGHMAFLENQYAAGKFLLSGPKVPRSGGVIIAISSSKEEVEKLITGDPFHAHNLANFTITEFVPRGRAESLK